MPSTPSWRLAIHLSLACLLMMISLQGIGFACVSPVSRVKGVAESIRAAINAYAADSEGHRFPPTTAIARYTDLVRIVNNNGATLPDTEPRTESRRSVWRRELSKLIGAFSGSTGCSSAVCPPGLWSFTSYRASDDGHDYTLMLRVENVHKPVFVIVTPQDVDTQHGVAASSAKSASEP
ncbi:hypothetical protein [Candidatus Entotheonella palauensis]|nr:hypothetical protein [Candidatus Entotheonella palauensis]